MSSGVAVNAECLEVFQQLKLGKKHKYIIFKLSDDNKEIQVEKASASPSYDDFVADLPPSTCRYAIYDFEYEREGEGKRNKICFYAWHSSFMLDLTDWSELIVTIIGSGVASEDERWSPDEAKVKTKMLYASSKDAIRRSLVGIASEIQGTDHSEIAYTEVLDKVSRGTS